MKGTHDLLASDRGRVSFLKRLVIVPRQLLRGSPCSKTITPKRIKGDEGFTLLEMLVVVAILGMLIGLVAPAVLHQLGGARLSVARQSVQRFSSILDIYKLDVGGYPTTEQGLAALIAKPTDAANWNGPYLQGKAIPSDAWGRAYIYRNPSIRPGLEYDLCSRGPKGQAGDSGPDLICNAQ